MTWAQSWAFLAMPKAKHLFNNISPGYLKTGTTSMRSQDSTCRHSWSNDLAIWLAASFSTISLEKKNFHRWEFVQSQFFFKNIFCNNCWRFFWNSWKTPILGDIFDNFWSLMPRGFFLKYTVLLCTNTHASLRPS